MSSDGQDSQPLFEADGITKEFPRSTSVVDTILRRSKEPLRAVDDVSISLAENEITGVIGESGCGKTTLLKMMGNLMAPTKGTIRYEGQDIGEMTKAERMNFRSNVQFIFQDPFNSLNPRMTVRETLTEVLEIHDFDNHDERIHDVLERVELNPPERFVDQRPPALSGGEKQRVSIARALIVEPSVLLADEPVSMLDVSTQASILKLLSNLSTDLGVSIMYISHDISTVSYLCEDINVMYLGRLVERGPTEEIINDPKHPYTNALIQAVPIPDPHNARERTKLEGATPEPVGLGEGCRFRDRCPSIIPPDDIDISQEGFREIMTLRQQISKQAVNLDHVELTLENAGVSESDESHDSVGHTLYTDRFETELPDRHRQQVETALAHVANEDWNSASEALADYKSVCEQTPRSVETGEHRESACHLYDEQRAGVAGGSGEGLHSETSATASGESQ
ncbi:MULTISPECIES: ABC transporter ATP-binding protein [Salinibaculum]|uniref:ABC transporter ATP-binding protein n=1 Tax=Salinibaculum TaxID=2732368 RepID=UPI0030D1255A